MTDNINNTDVLRKVFEEWFGSQGLWRAHSCAKDRKSNGEYDDYLAEKYWKQFQEEKRNG